MRVFFLGGPEYSFVDKHYVDSAEHRPYHTQAGSSKEWAYDDTEYQL